jgi:hypothetical protein
MPACGKRLRLRRRDGFIAPDRIARARATIGLSSHAGRPMQQGMLKIPPPMSNYERQRQFCERNPGYYQRLRAKRRAESAALAARRDTAQTMAAKREPLMLPAPVETIEIPGVTTIEAIRASDAVEVPVR